MADYAMSNTCRLYVILYLPFQIIETFFFLVRCCKSIYSIV